MPPRAAVLARTVLVLTLAVSTLTLASTPGAVAVTSPRALNDTRPTGSAPVVVGFPIEYFGVVAELASRSSHLPEVGPAPYGEARFRVGGRWTAWRPLEQDGAQAPGQFTGALMSVDRADAYQVRGLPVAGSEWRAAAINTTDGPAVVVGDRPAGAASAAPACRSRADWGADESISGWSDGDTPDFSPAQVITVHHTAGSNDPSQDDAATVRAIYSFHVQTSGWSDIGYQYLVDGDGVVYEGRSTGRTSTSCLYAGGDGSDFAHAPDDTVVTGAHVRGYNTGNLGISVMGCFEPGSATCDGDTVPTGAALTGVRGLVASLASRHDLDTEGTTHYVNPVNDKSKDIRTVSGHRDWSQTACPGSTLYDRLPSVRASSVRFRRARRTVKESAGTVRLTVLRSGNTSLPGTVHYARTAGSATQGEDFSLARGTLAFEAGQRRARISLPVLDDRTSEGRETIRVTLRNPGAATRLGSPRTMTVRIAQSDQRPDGRISTTRRSGYVGDDIYNRTGYHQTRRLRARRTQVRTFWVRIGNDGQATNSFTLRASRPRSASRVRYYSGSIDVTTAMRSSEGWRVRLRPGRSRLVQVRIKIWRAAEIGSVKRARVRATWSGDSLRTDVVRALVKVVR